MKTIDLNVNVPEERVITLHLPEDVTPGEHRVLIVIDDAHVKAAEIPLFSLEGLWAGRSDISPEDIAQARQEMWRKFNE